jgi:hypothetical protein
MGLLHDFAVKHHKFTENIESYVEGIIDDNQALLNLNREQLREEHKTVKDQFIKPKYSLNYAKLKGFTVPDLYVTGDMFNAMTIEAKGEQFEINSGVDYAPKLIDQYSSDIFGIAPTKQKRAKQITTEALTKQYKSACYTT